MIATSRIAAILALVLVAALHASADTISQTFDSFDEIDIAWVVDGEIRASPDNTYKLWAYGTKDLINALVVSKDNSILKLGTKPNTQVTIPAGAVSNFTVLMPKQKLKKLQSMAAGGALVDGTTLAADKFELTNSGYARHRFENVTTPVVNVQQTGSGVLSFLGNMKKVTYTVTGSGSGYFLGVSDSISIDATGSALSYVNGTGNYKISGQVTGSGKVNYTGGSCSVTSVGGASACQQTALISAPALVQNQPARTQFSYTTSSSSASTQSNSSSSNNQVNIVSNNDDSSNSVTTVSSGTGVVVNNG